MDPKGTQGQSDLVGKTLGDRPDTKIADDPNSPAAVVDDVLV